MPTPEAVAAAIRTQLAGHFNDLDYLVRLIEDNSISDRSAGNELGSRLVTLLEASSDGSAGGVTHFAGIFSGCRDRGFRDAFKDGNNQVGHFLTAVDMGFRPSKTTGYLQSLSVGQPQSFAASLFGAVRLPWEEEACIRLIIGHEQIPDTAPQWIGNARALGSPNDAEIATFLGPLNRVSLSIGNLEVTKSALNGIRINNGQGNSFQDLHLSLYGYQLGRFIRKGQIITRPAAAAWVRGNIGGNFAPH